MHLPLNIAICGCGPAGLAAALLLHQQQHRVCLVERFDHACPVGSGLILQPTGLAVLAELQLINAILQQGARIDRLFGRVMPSGRVVLEVQYRAMGAGWHGVAVHRATLFDVLHQAVVRAGIPVQTGTQVTHVRAGDTSIDLFARDDRHVGRFDLIVDALGGRSPLLPSSTSRHSLAYGALWANVRWPAIGFSPHALEQRYRSARQMTGILPIGSRADGLGNEAAFFWSLQHRDFEPWRRQSLRAWKDDVAALWPEAAATLEDICDHEQLTFARYDHFTLSRPYVERLVHIGDAAHSTSPQLGQGANMALLDALALARAIQTEVDVSGALHRYARMRRHHVRLFQAASQMFTPFYQTNSRVLPWLRDRVAAPLSRLPVADRLLARLVAGLTTAPLKGTAFQPWRAGDTTTTAAAESVRRSA